jgi:hypothetical protein
VVKPPLRTKTLGTKVSEEEFAQLEAAASERGLTLSEWCRDAFDNLIWPHLDTYIWPHL